MRKILLVTLLLLSTRVFAEWGFGVEEGATFSLLKADQSYTDLKGNIEYSIGFSSFYYLSPMASLNAGIGRTTVGRNYIVNLTNNSGTVIIPTNVSENYNVLIVPVYVSIGNHSRNLHPFINVGLQYQSVTRAMTSYPRPYNYNISLDADSKQLCLLGGFGISKSLGAVEIKAECRYIHTTQEIASKLRIDNVNALLSLLYHIR